MKQIVFLALIAISFSVQPASIKPVSCALEKDVEGTIVFTYAESPDSTHKIWKKVGTAAATDFGCTLVTKIMTCDGITENTVGKFDLYLGADAAAAVASNKLTQQLQVVAGQNVYKMSKTSLKLDESEDIDFTLFLGLVADDETKIGYKDGTTNNKFTTCTKYTDAGKEEMVKCPVKIAKEGNFTITFDGTDSTFVLAVSSSFLTVSLAIMFSLFLF